MKTYRDVNKRDSIFIMDRGPREMIKESGVSGLADWELLAVLIGAGVRGHNVVKISNNLLKKMDSPDKRDLSLKDIQDIAGIGAAKGTLILAALELGRRMYHPGRRKVGVPADVIPLVRHYGDRPQEHFITVSLNGAHEVISVRVITVGLVNKTLVHPREVFSEAVRERATSIIVAHNHPSGNIQPSEDDKEVTQNLRKAGTILGISVLDHIIFSPRGEYYSFLEHSL